MPQPPKCPLCSPAGTLAGLTQLRQRPMSRPDCPQRIQPLFPFSFPKQSILLVREFLSQSTKKLITQCCKRGGSREDVFTSIKKEGERKDEGHERTARISLTLNNPPHL